MRIDIQSRGFELEADVLAQADMRARMALGRQRHHISRVVVSLEDINGPRGGEDKRCVVQVMLAHAGSVVVEDLGQDLRNLIDRSLARAGRSVARRLSRLAHPRYPSRRVVYIARPDPAA